MYHRYTPTAHGRHQRQTVDRPSPPRHAAEPPKQPQKQPDPPKPQTQPSPAPVGNFLSRLLPGMDQGDLLVLLILLLLLAEGNEDSATVVMTLAIYLLLQ